MTDRLPDELESVARIRHRVNGASEIKPRRRINWPLGFTVTDDPIDEEADIAWSLSAIPGIDEYISDTAGAMFTGNTETGITATYQDSDNTIDLVVGVDGTSTSINGSNQVQRNALTGDVTASAGDAATTIANDAVTYAKMQNVNQASRVLGRGSAAGSGDVQELTVSGGVEFNGTDIRNAAISGDITIAAGSTSAAITSGSIVSADFNREAATAWTPGLTGAWTASGIGGVYLNHGRLYSITAGVTINATDASHLGITGFQTAASDYHCVGIATDVSSGIVHQIVGIIFSGTSTCYLYAPKTDATYATISQVTSTVPFSWAAGDTIGLSIVQIASS